jgi:histidinol-phosphate aminotransferase
MVRIARGAGRCGIVGPDLAVDIPEKGIAIIDSPSDPLGSILMPADAVRLSRASKYLVIDERFAEFSEFSLLPLAIEFENVMILRSFEAWAGLQSPSCAWAVASPRLAAALGLKHATLEPDTIAAAIATLNSQDSVHATLKLIRDDRSRLYRLLRKLSFVEPLPSWGPFLSARVLMVHRAALVDELLARGIRIHAPSQPGLEQFIRIGIGSRTAMDRMRSALLELTPQFLQ